MRLIDTVIGKPLVFMINRLWAVIAAYVGTVLLASYILKVREGWDFYDGTWYARVTALTIGFGDKYPEMFVSRQIMMAFAVFWIIVIMAAIVLNLYELGARDVAQLSHDEQEHILWLSKVIAIARGFDPGPEPEDTDHGSVKRKLGNPGLLGKLLAPMVNKLWVVAFVFFGSVLLAAVLLSVIETQVVDGQDKFDMAGSLWFAEVTALTIGYGDMAPQSLIGREVTMLFAHFWVMIVIPAFIANILVKFKRTVHQFTHREQEYLIRNLRATATSLGIDPGPEPWDTAYGNVDARFA